MAQQAISYQPSAVSQSPTGSSSALSAISAVKSPTGLSSAPRSKTHAQLQRLFGWAAANGLSHEELRDIVGHGPLRDLSAAQASEAIQRLTGRKLVHKPGTRPPRRRSRPGVIRMITPEHEKQIRRLGLRYFPNRNRFRQWLYNTFEVLRIRDLGTAQRAGNVIYVLRTMLNRKKEPTAEG